MDKVQMLQELRDEVRAINKVVLTECLEIGKEYVQIFNGEGSYDLEARVRKINDLKLRVRELEREAVWINEAVKCPRCGQLVSPEAEVCVKCGYVLLEVTYPEKVQNAESGCRCKNCGSPMEKDDLFCIMCGTKAADDVPMCASCGRQLDAGSKFCCYCGAKQ